ncbi:MAG: bifunctional DNA-formamidopyrimidine glycosylase/DNA-(apurinic or apyrimidinic site) lyase [Minisyncoccota bacterium]
MPELPEVQTVVSQLQQKIVGKTMAYFWSDWTKKVFPSKPIVARDIRHAVIIKVRRLGKHIVLDLNTEYSLVIHLKMTGHILIKTPNNRNTLAFQEKINGYIHHIITFTDDTTFEFSDMRKFGWLRMVPTKDVMSLDSIALLGPDALSPVLTSTHFQEVLSPRRHALIGSVLLEQRLIAGIGNIYRSEILFSAGILPKRALSTLSQKEWKSLFFAVQKVLRQAIRSAGTSDGDFRDTDGLPGKFQNTIYVYRRDRQLCKKCGTIIQRDSIGKRSIFFCPSCQK